MPSRFAPRGAPSSSTPTRSPFSADADPAACLNCETPLAGPYCSQCGQPAEDIRKPFRSIAAELTSDAFSFDSRFFRTLGPLFLRPGFLTTEYLAGRREPYVPPLRIYVFASVVFFGLVALFGTPLMRVQVGGASPEVQSRATAFVNTAITYLHFFLVPAFAGCVMLFFRRARRYYIEHLVFSLHYGAFAFLFFTILGTILRIIVGPSLDQQPASVQGLGALLPAVVFVYLIPALRRVYGFTWRATIVRAVGVVFLYLVVFALAVLALSLVAYLLA